MRATCVVCNSSFDASGGRGRTPRHCSGACRQRAYRARKAESKPVFPKVMTDAKRWVRAEHKKPLQLSGRNASSTNPDTWSTFEEVISSQVGNGYGFMVGNGIGCIDLDNAIDPNGTLKPWAVEVIESNPHPVVFREVSMSGKGVHIFVEAPEGKGFNRLCGDGRHEFYPGPGRFIRVTGNILT